MTESDVHLENTRRFNFSKHEEGRTNNHDMTNRAWHASGYLEHLQEVEGF